MKAREHKLKRTKKGFNMAATFKRFASALLFSAFFAVTGCLCGADDNHVPAADQGATFPFYFIAIHNEPANAPGAMDSQYKALLKIIGKADECNIRLTLMFASTWVDYLLDSSHPERKKSFESWQTKGHEISAHYHGIHHPGFWDGYSPLGKEETEQVRIRYKRNPFHEEYRGSMTEFAEKLARLDSNINSGCLNEETCKDFLPGRFTVLTGSGFANRGEVGIRKMDAMLEYGVNEYILVGNVNGIERRWLSHSHAMRQDQILRIKDIMGKMHGGVYGAVTHSLQDERIDQVKPIVELMDYLGKKDPGGKKSVTVREIVEKKILPEKRIADEVLLKSEVPPAPGQSRGFMLSDGIGSIDSLIVKCNMLLEKCKTEGADVSDAEKMELASRIAMQEGKPDECRRKLQEAIEILVRIQKK